MDKHLFKYYQSRNGDTVSSTARALNLTRFTLSNRLNGRTRFTVDDIMILRERWHLTAEQCEKIFLNTK